MNIRLDKIVIILLLTSLMVSCGKEEIKREEAFFFFGAKNSHPIEKKTATFQFEEPPTSLPSPLMALFQALPKSQDR